MSFLSNPRSLYIVRLVQLAFAIGVLVLVSYASTHRGWWSNLTAAIAVAVISFLFTTILAIHTIITHHRSNPFSATGKAYTVLRLIAEILTFLLWIATVGLMLRHKAGCEIYGPDENNDRRPACWIDMDTLRAYKDERPKDSWNIGVAFSLVECVSFLITILLVFKDNRTNKVSGEASYA